MNFKAKLLYRHFVAPSMLGPADENLPYPDKCPVCRGAKLLCGLPWCPVIKDKLKNIGFRQVTGKVLEGPSSPEVFIGKQNYPNVIAGPLIALSNIPTPPTQELFGKGVMDVASMRMGVVRSKRRLDVRHVYEPDRYLQTTQELAISSVPANTEVTFEKEKKFEAPKIDGFYLPMGPSGDAIKAKVIDNIVVPRKVDAVTSDTDAMASDGLGELYGGGIDVDYLTRILSTGMLGRKNARKLVPTRWAITAVDDTVGKQVADKVRDMPELGEYAVYSGEYIGNFFWVLFIPGPWSFEMIEVWLKDEAWKNESSLINDFEGPEGRKGYAKSITGAYYAARLEAARHILSANRQATAIVLREISSDYFMPLGVWVIRETVKNILAETKPAKFTDLDSAIEHISSSCHVRTWHKKSELIERKKTQRTLFDFGG